MNYEIVISFEKFQDMKKWHRALLTMKNLHLSSYNREVIIEVNE